MFVNVESSGVSVYLKEGIVFHRAHRAFVLFFFFFDQTGNFDSLEKFHIGEENCGGLLKIFLY